MFLQINKKSTLMGRCQKQAFLERKLNILKCICVLTYGNTEENQKEV